MSGFDAPLVRTSERRSFKRCPQQWWWAWRQGLKPKQAAPALWFGSGIHNALEAWYGTGTTRNTQAPFDIWDAWCDEEERVVRIDSPTAPEDPEWVEARDLGKSMLERYFQKWGNDPNWDVIATERAFQIGVPDPDNADVPIVVYSGTFDGVFRDLNTGKIWLMEHKTAKAIQVNHLTLDDQAGSYYWVAPTILAAEGLLKPGERIDGIMYNFLRKGLPDLRPTNSKGQHLNKDGSVSKVQPAALFARHEVYRSDKERVQMGKRVQSEARLMNMMRNDPSLVFKTPTRDCAWDCPFFSMCEMHEAGQDWREYRDLVYRVEDPYADHRKSTEG